MPISTPNGIDYADDQERYLLFNLQDPAARERLRTALCGEDVNFQRVIEVRGPSGIGKGYLLQSAAVAAGRSDHAWTYAALDLDATNPEGVSAGDYVDKLLTELRQRRSSRQRRRAQLLEALIQEAKVNLQVKAFGWDQLAWLPLGIKLELPLARLRELMGRHLAPDQRRPEPERFIETLLEMTDQVSQKNGSGLLLQIPEQRQPEASVRDLLLERLPGLPNLILAFSQSDAGAERDYQGLEPLRIGLSPFTATQLGARIQAGLGAHDLPHPWLHAITLNAQGMPGLAAMALADLIARDLLPLDAAGVRRPNTVGPNTMGSGTAADDTAEIDRLLGPGLYQPLHRRLAQVRDEQGPQGAEDLQGFLDLACLCGRNIPFGPLADTWGWTPLAGTACWT
jgi:hypothetical protein